MKRPLILQMSPRMASLRQGDVSVSSLPSTGGQSSGQRHLFNSQAEGQDSLRQTVLYDFNNKSSKEQIKETVPSLGQNWLPPCNSDVIQSWNKI